MSSSSSRNERRLAAKNGGREGGESATQRLHAWVRRELSLLVASAGPGWVGRPVKHAWDGPSGGCRGCGRIGRHCALTMLSRQVPADKVVLFTLAEMCEECAGDTDKMRSVGDAVFGPLPPSETPGDPGAAAPA